jgi:hypothetical protein
MGGLRSYPDPNQDNHNPQADDQQVDREPIGDALLGHRLGPSGFAILAAWTARKYELVHWMWPRFHAAFFWHFAILSTD